MGRHGLKRVAISRAKQLVGPRASARLRCIARGLELPRWGNLRRTRPFSSTYGFERGTPIDRHYLHRFFDANRDAIRGRVLEVQVTAYTERYGRNVQRAESFDIVPEFSPTYQCDFTAPGGPIPPAAFDAVLLPNTLPHMADLDSALAQVRRILRPGGTLLASAAGLLPLTGDVPDFWRLSPDGWRLRLARAFPTADVLVEGHGNCLAAVAAQLGLAVEELSEAELDVHDPRYPILTTMICHL